MRDEVMAEEVRLRATQEKMNEAFRDAMYRAIRVGQESVPTVVSTEFGTQRPKVVLVHFPRR